jgi:hypothetical protein
MPHKDLEKRNAYYRKWRAKNPERARNSKRKWRAANPEKAKESRRKWRAANREKERETPRKCGKSSGGTKQSAGRRDAQGNVMTGSRKPIDWAVRCRRFRSSTGTGRS